MRKPKAKPGLPGSQAWREVSDSLWHGARESRTAGPGHAEQVRRDPYSRQHLSERLCAFLRRPRKKAFKIIYRMIFLPSLCKTEVTRKQLYQEFAKKHKAHLPAPAHCPTSPHSLSAEPKAMLTRMAPNHGRGIKVRTRTMACVHSSGTSSS